MTDTSTGMPLGVLAAIKQEASHLVRNSDPDELLFAERRVLDLVKRSIPAVHQEIIQELRKNPANTVQVIADRHGETMTATRNAARLRLPKDSGAIPPSKGYTISAAAQALHTYPEIIRDRVKRNPGAAWFSEKHGPKRTRTLITDLAPLKKLLPADHGDRYSITEAAEALGVQRSLVVACVNRNLDKAWVIDEHMPGSQRAKKGVTNLEELKRALARGPRGLTPAQAAEASGLTLSEIRSFIKTNPDSPTLERSKGEGGRSINRIIDLPGLKRELAGIRRDSKK
jgi:hypothetical protein